MPDRRTIGRDIGLTLGRLNRVDQRGELVAGLVDVDLTAFLLRYRIVRPDDLLVLDVSLSNLVPRAGVVRRRDADRPGLLIVVHQPQSILEQAFEQLDGQAAADYKPKGASARHVQGSGSGTLAFPAQACAAGPSRLVFAMPDGIEAAPFSLDGILEACRTWPLHLAWAAQPAPAAESRWQWHLADLRKEAVLLRELLGKAVVARHGQAVLAALDRHAGSLAAALAGGRQQRAGFQREVARAVAAVPQRTPGAQGDDLAAVSRAYLEVAAADAMFALELSPAAQARIPGLWPYLVGLPTRPAQDRTAIELPYRLQGSPLPGAGFTHALRPVEHAGRTELWNTRLGRRGPDGVDDRSVLPMRYLWSPDYPAESPDPFVASLSAKDRRMLVDLTANYATEVEGKPGKRYVPRPVAVGQLHLTALGGTLDLDKSWLERARGTDIQAWKHRATLGRDHYVRVEYAGYLYPFGHAATLIKVTERKFVDKAPYGAVAPLFQRWFIVVRDRIRRFDGQPPQPEGGRGLPFGEIECLTRTTVDLQPPGSKARDRVAASGLYADASEWRMAFWPAMAGPGTTANLLFKFAGTDHADRRIPFECPVLFVSDLKNTPSHLSRIGPAYELETERRRSELAGSPVSMAKADDAAQAAEVEVPVQAMTWRARAAAGTVPYGQACFYPDMDRAQVKLQAMERLAGLAGTAQARYPDAYRSQGWGGANAGQVFLAFDDAGVVDFGASSRSDAAGGIASPVLVPRGLSRATGVGFGDLDALVGGTFDPSRYFDAGAKLLGFIPLKDLLTPGRAFAGGEGVPLLRTLPFSDGVRTEMSLRATKRDGQLVVPDALDDMLVLDAGGDTELDLRTTHTAWFDPARPPESVATGTLTHFKVNLFGVIVLWFDRLRFHVEAGKKPEVDVDLEPTHGVTFGGPLEFVNTLKEFIPATGFSDPPGLAVTPQGITASYSLGLPNVQVGILALSNINLGASFNLPFTGEKPSLRFNFAERHNTFNLTVSLFGGGGFFAIGVDSDGVREIEAALEFGASIQIDLGVASGGVYVKGGFYFHFEDQDVHFEGFVEMGGRLSVLGLVSVSLTFHLALAYDCRQIGTKPDGSPRSETKLYGEASLVVEVDVLFFSASVEVRVRREFAGAESDPTFADLITDQSTWTRYCKAFA